MEAIVSYNYNFFNYFIVYNKGIIEIIKALFNKMTK